MPANIGECPPIERVDIKLRNGLTIRGEEAKRWRWTLNDPAFPPAWGFDIVTWQVAA